MQGIFLPQSKWEGIHPPVLCLSAPALHTPLLGCLVVKQGLFLPHSPLWIESNYEMEVVTLGWYQELLCFKAYDISNFSGLMSFKSFSSF